MEDEEEDDPMEDFGKGAQGLSDSEDGMCLLLFLHTCSCLHYLVCDCIAYFWNGILISRFSIAQLSPISNIVPKCYWRLGVLGFAIE